MNYIGKELFKLSQMKKVKLFLIVGFMLLTSCCCIAQTVSDLINTKWKYEKRGIAHFIEFTKDSIIETRYNYYDGFNLSFSKPYYLSEVLSTCFDKTKVGTPTSGKYLLYWNEKLHIVEYCEIKELSADSLVLFYEAKPNYVGAADVYITYKRLYR